MFSSWRLDPLARFYNVSQDFEDFCLLVASLEEVRNTLYLANDGYAIGDYFTKPSLLCQSRVSTSCPGHTKLCVRELESQRTDQRHGKYAVEPRRARLHGSHVALECPGDERCDIPLRALRPIAEDTLHEDYCEVLISYNKPGVMDQKAGTITVILPLGVVVPSCVLEGDPDNDEDGDH
ncbi:hypothetical protein BDR06DRAFT_1010244 [Suillus hirtellus]|nr:hypothetical protein BDR06DRAFT_1010244 [Suillus hirtellus]